MRVVATFHPPSGVEHSLKCSLTNDADLEHLVVAKSNRLEVYSVQPQGLKHECGLDIWGHIVSLRAIPSGPNSLRSNLLVLTDHPDAKLILLSYNVNAKVASLESKQHVSLQDRSSRYSEFVNDIIVHPSGKVAVVCCYTGKLRIVEFKDGKIAQDYDVIIHELNLLSTCFLSGPEDSLVLAMINLDHKQRLQLLCRSLDLPNQELSPELDPTIPNTLLSQNIFPSLDTPPSLVPVPPHTAPSEDEEGSHLGGVLIFGGRKVLFFEHASEEKQEIAKGKQQRQAKRLSSKDHSEVQKAREKEKQREAKEAKPRWSVKWPWSDVVATCSVDDEGRRYLIGDEYGRLAMLVFSDSYGLILLPLGETSPPTSLTYLTSQHLYLGSRLGPSQLLRIHTSPCSKLDEDTLPIPKGITTVPPSALSPSGKGKQRAGDDAASEGLSASSSKEGLIVLGKGSYVQVVESFENIGPIWDATLADLDGSGQPQIITCSGARNAGSLNVVRTGADFQEFAVVHGIPGVIDLWPVRSRFEDSTDSYLVASTLYETYVFRLDAKDTVTHLDPPTAGFITSSQTLAVSNIRQRIVKTTAGRSVSSYEDSALVVQVTPEGLRLLEYDPTLRVFSVKGSGWTPSGLGVGWQDRTIVAADINASQIVLGLSGGKLVLLTLGDNASFTVMHNPREFPDEISAVSCAPFDPAKNYTMQLAVSFWGSNKVAILSLESKETYLTTIFETGPLPCLPRSLLLHNFGTGRRAKYADYYPHLLVGGNDGSLISYVYKDNALKDMKVHPLGDTPVSLAVCKVDGKDAVFASGGRAAVIYWDRQRLQRSSVMLKDLVRGTSLNTSFFPSALVVATTSGLLIGKVRGVDKMQIKNTPLGLDNPRRIAHCPSLKVVGVITKRTVPSRIGEESDTTSSFKVLEQNSFIQIAEWIFSADQELSAVLSLPDGEDGRSPCFCVGSVQYRANEVEPSSGRIMLFAYSPSEGSARSHDNTLRMVATEETPGCVYALAYIRGMIVAAVNTSVILYKLGVGNDSSVVLEKASQWNHNYITLNLVARGDYIVVGDAINSVSVLEIDGTLLKCVARDYSPLWPVALDATANGNVVGANSDCNLFSFSTVRNARTSVLEKDGNFYLGEIVNKILPGRLGTAEVPAKPALESEHLFFTSTGRIGVILRLADEFALTMTNLQRNLGDAIIGPGDTHHGSWRAPANFRGRSDAELSTGFLDGDFLENYFTYPDQSKLLAGDNEAKRIATPQNVIEEVLEELQSLH